MGNYEYITEYSTRNGNESKNTITLYQNQVLSCHKQPVIEDLRVGYLL